MSRGKRQRQREHPAPSRPAFGWLLTFVVMLTSVVLTGVGVAYNSHQVREQHVALKQLQTQHDELLADHSRLLLERSALSSYQNVDRLAVENLAMKFPGRDTPIVERVPGQLAER